ncbi:retrovirus-related Pol polyprotein from transposon 17.6 [Trichonephila clavata]|uniref:Retrovirus-related Pol polyprotein from transposon 17.6 n=1 Tax=Trichonephila clavata TaxID=2740835 RepID=A0A8X6H5H9_TRICU|nr:retrovirus-related Pol polyprotein from transposon 17.6 [Trichonephila clavata]
MTSDIPFPTDVPNCQEALKEERKQASCAVGLSVEELPIISRVSSFRKLQRVLAWCLRFISNAKLTSTERKFGALTTKELEKGLVYCIKQVQVTNFASELKCLQSGKPLPANSRTLNLYPFIDNDGILRVGGRLKNANLKFCHKHPAILPDKHCCTMLNHCYTMYVKCFGP